MAIINSMRVWALAAMAAAVITNGAHAADLTETDPESTLTPDPNAEALVAIYGWIAFLKGDITINGQTVAVDTNVFDIIRASDDLFVFEAYTEYRFDDISVYLDATVLDLGIGRRNFAPAPIGTGLRMDYTWALIEAGAKYEVTAWTSNGIDRHGISVLAGGRYTYNDIGMLIRVGPFRRNFSDTLNWIDPIVGVHYRGNFGNGWRANAKADIGGFGIGLASDISVQLLANVAKTIYQNDTTEVSVALGYRYLYQDWSKGRGANRDAVDLTTHGPFLGLAVRF